MSVPSTDKFCIKIWEKIFISYTLSIKKLVRKKWQLKDWWIGIWMNSRSRHIKYIILRIAMFYYFDWNVESFSKCHPYFNCYFLKAHCKSYTIVIFFFKTVFKSISLYPNIFITIFLTCHHLNFVFEKFM